MAEKTKAATKVSKISKKPKIVRVAAKTTPKKQVMAPKTTGLVVKVFDLKGKAAGTVTLPKEIFGQTPNRKLLAQAIRVYRANQIPRTAHTKIRAEVRGGGAKPWRQKGTGRARAGSRRSPLWVGGGTTFGPRAKVVKLSLPQKMKHKALIYALSDKAKSGNIRVLANIEKVQAKTKPIAQLLRTLAVKDNALLVISQKNQNVNLATRNIPNLSVELPQNLNAYEIVKNNELLLSREAVNSFK
ncbi:50S ribosomal protein L4 [Candidatus Curtissbacteria bacterium]|nr:50S ribosomal protein L4 [Candidatus Curtissbacteria bacterium]